MRKLSVWMLIVLLPRAVFAQSGVSDKNVGGTAETKLAQEVKELREAFVAQQKQIQELQKQMEQRDAALQKALQQIELLKSAQAAAAMAAPTNNHQALANGVNGLSAKKPAAEPSSESARPVAAGTIEPPHKPESEKSNSAGLTSDKLSIGGLFYGDYGYYYHTGFGPQFLTQINPPGPGNNGYNSFDVNRAYLDLLYSPSEAVTLRVTPNIYRQIGVAPSSALGSVSGIGSNTNTELTYRLKYAYADFNTLFAGISPLEGDKLTVGQQPNVLVDWEENLYGFRFVNLTPWNYLSLASAQTGVSVHGPIKFSQEQYLDYAIAVYDNSTFHTLEESETKQAMGRLSFYPFGATSTFEGFGLTGAFDYGYTDVTPDTPAHWPVYRIAGLAHFSSKSNGYGIVAEYDRGRNAFTSGNLFSGSGPADEFGLGPTPYANFDALARSLLNYNGTEQRGFAVFGHAAIPRSKFTLFGMYEYFQPNIRVFRDPLDFERGIVGISYKYNDHVRLALDTQNLLYTHNQFTFPSGELAEFSPTLAAQNPAGIGNAVPTSMKAVFLNIEFKFDRQLRPY